MISDLLVRITSSPDNIDYLNKKYGSDFMNKIFDASTDENFLFSIEKSLDEKNGTKKTGFFSESTVRENRDQNNKNERE